MIKRRPCKEQRGADHAQPNQQADPRQPVAQPLIDARHTAPFVLPHGAQIMLARLVELVEVKLRRSKHGDPQTLTTDYTDNTDKKRSRFLDSISFLIAR